MPTFRDNLHLGDKDPVIDSDSIADGAITTDKIEDQAITHDKMACESVGACQIIDGEVSLEKLSPDVRGMLQGAAGDYSELEGKIDAVAADVKTNTDDIKDIKDGMVKGIQVNGGVTLRPDPLGVVHMAVGGGDGQGGDPAVISNLDSRLQGVENQVYRYSIVNGQPTIIGYKIGDINTRLDAVEPNVNDLAGKASGIKQVVFLDYKDSDEPSPVEGKYWLDDSEPYLYKGVVEDGTLQWKMQDSINGKLYVFNNAFWRIDNDEVERLTNTSDEELMAVHKTYLDTLYIHRETGKLYWMGSNFTLSEVKPWAEDLANLPVCGGSGIVYAYISSSDPAADEDNDVEVGELWFDPNVVELKKRTDSGWSDETLSSNTLVVDKFNKSMYLYIADIEETEPISPWNTAINQAIDQAINQAMTTLRNEIAAMANTGHRVMIVAYWQEGAPDFTNAAADLMNYNMSHGIYWMKPSTLTLYKGIYDERASEIDWNINNPVALSEEVLYVDRTGRKMYVAKNKKKYSTDPDRFELIEVPYLLRQVSINVDTSEASENYEHNEDGWEFVPRPFTTDPTGYERLVNISINGERYNESQPPVLPAGEYGVEYELEDGFGYVGDSKSYDIIVTQDEEPEAPMKFNMKRGNPGLVDIEGDPEDITAEMVRNAYTIPELYPNAPVGYDPNYPDRPHIWTAAEIGLQLGTTNTIGTTNYNRIKDALANETCIGFKLDNQYSVYLEYLRVNKTGSYIFTANYNVNPNNFNDSDKIIVLPRDFIIDGEGVVGGQSAAVGGLINIHGGQGTMIYTSHSLCMNKVHISVSQEPSYNIPSVFVDCRNGIDQFQAKGCVFDGGSSPTRPPYAIGLYFDNVPPIGNETDTNGEYDYTKDNKIGHVYIDSCTCKKNLVTNMGKCHCVTQSFRIIGNTVTDIMTHGVLMSTFNEYENTSLMSFASCPLWMVGNTFEGRGQLVRSSSDYYCGALIENCVVYSLWNTFENFIAATYYAGGGSTHRVGTYDQYFNGRQLYFANNTSINIIFMDLYKATSGYLKAKSSGYIPSGFGPDHIPFVRYFKDNKMLLSPTEVKAIWDARTSSGSQSLDEQESLMDVNEVMSIVLDTYFGYQYIRDFTFSGNEVNAIWKRPATPNAPAEEDPLTGNIAGSQVSNWWPVANFIMEGNVFKASRMSSTEWGYRTDARTNSMTSVFVLQFQHLPSIPDTMAINSNDISVRENEHINLVVARYANNDTAVPASWEASGNTISTGSVARVCTFRYDPWASTFGIAGSFGTYVAPEQQGGE